jgi:hypothetical protein
LWSGLTKDSNAPALAIAQPDKIDPGLTKEVEQSAWLDILIRLWQFNPPRR